MGKRESGETLHQKQKQVSKRDLKKYLKSLKKKQLEEQILDLYTRFKPVKTYYNFVFKPDEEKLLEDAKFKISKEYFPINTRKPKMRRSVAQKLIKHFVQLGVDPYVITELMCTNIELAQKFTANKPVKQDAFYKSILNSYVELVRYANENGTSNNFMPRITRIHKTSEDQHWINSEGFYNALNQH